MTESVILVMVKSAKPVIQHLTPLKGRDRSIGILSDTSSDHPLGVMACRGQLQSRQALFIAYHCWLRGLKCAADELPRFGGDNQNYSSTVMIVKSFEEHLREPKK